MTDEEKAAFEKLLEKHAGSGNALAESLHRENLDYRRKNAALKTQLGEAKQKGAPDGAIVLSAEQGKAWEAYQALGAPVDLGKAVSDLKAAQGELATTRREKLLADAAAAHGSITPRALGKILDFDKLEAEVKEVQEDGRVRKVVHVRDGQGQTRTLAEHLEAEWPDLRPVEPEKPKGTPWVDQSSGGKAPKADLVDSFIERTQKAAASKPNPLMPQPTKTGGP